MLAEARQKYEKPDLVELLTGIRSERFSLDWVVTALYEPIIIEEADMENVYQAVKSYWDNRIENYGEDGKYTLYFLPAFKTIEAGYKQNNFRLFNEGCELLLSLIAKD